MKIEGIIPKQILINQECNPIVVLAPWAVEQIREIIREELERLFPYEEEGLVEY